LGSIVVLDPSIANKIAAGEVVANPASVVKELVENSIDAGSSRISVEIVSGGKEKIKVTDNGLGMDREDIELAFHRHATSKIKTFEDLNNISTMGFRGEALASIAAVSRVIMTSKPRGDSEGFRIEIEAGKIKSITPVGCAEGTTVEVSDLFFNTPARKKFLKSSSRETYLVNEIMTRYALGFSGIAIRLKNDSKTVFETHGNNKLIESIATIYGMDAAQNVMQVQGSQNGWSIQGYISKPFFTKGNRKYQHFFINGRWVANKDLRVALDNAYRSLIPKGRYPLAVLFLNTEKSIVDVNTDPTKNTVRIKGEKDLVDIITNLLKVYIYPKKYLKERGQGGITVKATSEKNLIGEGSQVEFKNAAFNFKTSLTHSKDYSENNNQLVFKEKEQKYPDLTGPRVIGQHNATYIIYELNESLYIVDQHAAHERVRYEELLKKENQVPRQLIVPKKLELTAAQIPIFNEVKYLLEEIGICAEFFGGNSIVLREIPVAVNETNCDKLFLDVLDELAAGTRIKEIQKDDVIKQLACKTSIKAGQPLSMREMEALLAELFATDNPMTCPHGRPTTIIISNKALYKEFSRGMKT